MIQFTSMTKNGDGGWSFAWAATGDPSYRVVLGGKLLATVTTPAYTYTQSGYSNYPPPIEVVPAGQKADSETYPPYAVLQWYAAPGAVGYKVQQNVSGVWQTVGSIDHPGWVNSYQTGTLSDDAVYSFRVYAVGALGDVSPPLPLSVVMVRVPDATDGTVQYAYAAGTLTVSAVGA